MNRYLYAALTGVAAFTIQLWLSIESKTEGMEGDPLSLFGQILAFGTPWGIAGTLGGYLFLGIASHAVPLILATKVHYDLKTRGPQWLQARLTRRGMHSLILLLTLILMLVANHFAFPASHAVPNSDLLMVQRASPIAIWALILTFGTAALYWVISIAEFRVRSGLAAAGALVLAAWVPSSPTPVSERARPDIIVIGVDSLRPDHLSAYGHPESLTPNINEFLQGAIRFDQTFTPLARTFVAYNSVLSGLYPVNHGARQNLYPSDLIKKERMIPHLLKREGYSTVFAMDESRFANFDQGYGFDVLATPPPGIMDFVIGDIFDTLGTNLAQLLPRSDSWMPHIAGNRAAATNYSPTAHDSRVRRALSGIDKERPLFFVSHYCIAHLPYILGSESDTIPQRYASALRVADIQVGDVLESLRSNGRLNNAIVVLLSDHGEALALPDDLWTIYRLNEDRKDDITFGQFFGHGLPAMDEAQSRVLLAFQRYVDGRPSWNPSSSSHPASLVDVAPTVLSAAGVEMDHHQFDGINLITDEGTPQAIEGRPVFVESGLSGLSLQKADIDPLEVASEFSHLFELTPDYHLQLKQEQVLSQRDQKQRAVFLERYAVSTWPSGLLTDRGNCWMKLDRESRLAECLPPETVDPVVATYKQLICRQFKDDQDFAEHWCSPDKLSVEAL